MKAPADSLLPPSLPPIGINRVQAAEFIGVSPSFFDAMVAAGTMPQPRRAGARAIWDVSELAQAFRALPQERKLAPGRPKRRLRETPGTDAFEQELAAARLGVPWPPARKAASTTRPVVVLQPAPTKGSMRWLVEEYRGRGRGTVTDAEFDRRLRELDRVVQHRRNGVAIGDVPYRRLSTADIAVVRDELKATTGGRDNLVRIVSALFFWSSGVGLMDSRANPCHGIRPLHAKTGFHTWTEAEVEAYEECHAIGTPARLALDLAMFTGLRRQELAIVGPLHVYQLRNDEGEIVTRIRVVPGKTSRSTAVEVDIPMLDVLAARIAATPSGLTSFLISRSGRPFKSPASLGNAMQRWTEEAGLPLLAAWAAQGRGHACGRERRHDPPALMAIYGWTTLSQAELYTRTAERKRMADAGIRLLEVRPAGTC